ncbi:hypothetical protein HOE31_02065 [bacterium]|jgi:hypothetical protein|nr:hypothetical protein [bacterium]MBT4121717.1 hypothetical protein [bacterium]MBT4335193.1 hypothetical protein [bacterium]MBT4495979.1 hypothetical protein [bacterium]MBT4763503.1 hypothetical protein [bacterium]
MPLEDRKKQVKKINKINFLLNKYFNISKYITFVIVVIMMVLIVLIPKIESINQKKGGLLEQKEQELRELETYYNNLKNLDTTVSEFKDKQLSNINKLNEVLPSEAEVPNLMAQLEAVTLSSGFSLSFIDIAEGSLLSADEDEDDFDFKDDEYDQFASGIHYLDITLSVQGGDYFKLKGLLANIERHLRLMDVMALSFAGGTDMSGYSLALRTYFYIP